MGNPYPVEIKDESGVVRLAGEADFTDPGNQPGGGSNPGSLRAVDVIFNEPGGAHADLVATVPVAAGETVLDVWLYALAAPWADEATLDVGDTGDASGYYSGSSVKLGAGQLDTVYTVGGAAQAFSNIIGSFWGASTYAAAEPFQSSANGGGILYPTGDTITATVAGIATGGGGGQLLIRIWILGAVIPIIAA